MAGIFAITSAIVWPRARRSLARQPQTSTNADMICDPARPTAWAISGQDSSIRSTRTFALRRRLVHHGMPHATVSATATTGIGGVAGPIAVAALSHPPVVAVMATA